MKKMFKSFITGLLLLVFLLPSLLSAQSRDFQLANRLIQQQEYSEALPILESLYNDYPETFVFFDRLTETLINLQEYDKAIELAENQIEKGRSVTQTRLKLAEFRHVKGEKESAYELWEKVLSENPSDIQAYYNTAESMSSRREYKLAAETYLQAQKQFNNRQLFLSELANAYMQAGEFEKAVQQYFTVVYESPNQMSFVQQRFLRMRDQNLYEIAALELEDFLLEVDRDHSSYSQLYQLLSWLFLETENYQRAFVFARQYESQTSQLNYSLYSLGERFLSARKFELAKDAFEFYTDSESNIRFRASEKMSEANIQWAQYLHLNSIGTQNRQNSLYREAYEINTNLLENAPNYNRRSNVLSTQIDLSLDHFKNIEMAQKWYDELESISETDEQRASFLNYARGRIALFNNDFTTARQALTRANRETDQSNLSEKIRYFLSLSDFYAGDYEFATIQLRSLERRQSSFYANNAIKLKMWINNGTRADTTGSTLQTVGEAMLHIHTGRYSDALSVLQPIILNTGHHFSDDMMVELATNLPDEFSPLLFTFIDDHLKTQPSSPLRERLMWERARLGERIFIQIEEFGDYQTTETTRTAEDLFFGEEKGLRSITKEELENLYEEILIEFPGGFYASYAREKLQEIPNLPS